MTGLKLITIDSYTHTGEIVLEAIIRSCRSGSHKSASRRNGKRPRVSPGTRREPSPLRDSPAAIAAARERARNFAADA